MTISLLDHLNRARRAYAALDRFASRRTRFLEALDLAALGRDDVRSIEVDTDRIMLELAEAWLLADNLEQQLVEAL